MFDLANLFAFKIERGGGIFLKPPGLPNPEDNTTFDGSKHNPSHQLRAVTTGPYDVLVLPIIENGQNSDGLFQIAKVGAYLSRTLGDVDDYYKESSFGLWQGFNFQIFGFNFAANLLNPVIELPKLVKDYYWPDYDPAQLVLTRTGIGSSDVIKFNGFQTMTVAVTVSPDIGRFTLPDLDLPTCAVVWTREDLKNSSISISLDTHHTLELVVSPVGFYFSWVALECNYTDN